MRHLALLALATLASFASPAMAQSINSSNNVINAKSTIDSSLTTAATSSNAASACPVGWRLSGSKCTLDGTTYEIHGWVLAEFPSRSNGAFNDCDWAVNLQSKKWGGASVSTLLFWSEDQGTTWNYLTTIPATTTSTLESDSLWSSPTDEIWIVAGRSIASSTAPPTLYWYDIDAVSLSTSCFYPW